jgi:NitT/TauT family transport system permease protein
VPENFISSTDEIGQAVASIAGDGGQSEKPSPHSAKSGSGADRRRSASAGALQHGWRRETLLALISILAGLILWEFAAGYFPQIILPAPSAVVVKMSNPAVFAKLMSALAGSLAQLTLGFVLAFGVAVPLGMIIGRSTTLTQMFEPVIAALYAIPPVTFVPFFIIWFGLFFEARVALVFLMCVFDILVIIIKGARDVRSMLLDVGRSFGASRSQQLRLIVFPAMTPFLFAALRVGSARAINGMITAELFFAAVNLGGILKQASQNFDTASAMAVVVVVCLLGLIVQSGITLFEARISRWDVRPA